MNRTALIGYALTVTAIFAGLNYAIMLTQPVNSTQGDKMPVNSTHNFRYRCDCNCDSLENRIVVLSEWIEGQNELLRHKDEVISKLSLRSRSKTN